MRSSSPRKLSWIARSSHRLSGNLSLSSLLEPGCHPGFLTDPSLRALAPRRPPRSPPLGTGNMLHKYYARNRWEPDEVVQAGDSVFESRRSCPAPVPLHRVTRSTRPSHRVAPVGRSLTLDSEPKFGSDAEQPCPVSPSSIAPGHHPHASACASSCLHRTPLSLGCTSLPLLCRALVEDWRCSRFHPPAWALTGRRPTPS